MKGGSSIGGAERWLQAADPRPVPADAPSEKRPRAGLPETRTLKTASAVIPRRGWFDSPAVFRPEHAWVLRQDRAGDGGGKNRDSAQCFGFRHGFSPYVHRGENPLLGRTFRYFKQARRLRSAPGFLPQVQCSLQCWDSASRTRPSSAARVRRENRRSIENEISRFSVSVPGHRTMSRGLSSRTCGTHLYVRQRPDG